MQKKSTIYNTLRVIYIFLTLAFPLIFLLIVGFSDQKIFFATHSFIDSLAYASYWFYALPIFAVYAGIISLRFFPTRWHDILLLFFPVLISFVSLMRDLEHAFASLTVSAVVFYVGLYLVLILGLIPLVIQEYRRQTENRSLSYTASQALVRFCVFFVLIAPPAITIWYAHNIAIGAMTTIYGDIPLYRLSVYFFQILLVASISYQKLVKLYFEGRL